MRRGSSVPATPKSEPSTSSRSGKSPKFLEHIAIKPDKSSQPSSKKSAGQPNAVVTESTVTSNMSVEMLVTQQFKYAILLDIPVEDIANNKLIQYIDSWYGTPYRYGGNDKNGIDCSAFVQTFMQYIYGIALARISAEQYRQSKRIDKEDLEEGDLVFFITRGRRAGVSHVGIYLCNNKFVHASTSGGVMISDLAEPYYQQHYSGAGRVKESIVSK